MNVEVTFTPEQFKRNLRVAVARGLTEGANVLADRMVRNFGTEGGGVVRKTRKGRNVYKAAPPGAFPGIRTGNLRRSIIYKAATEKSMVSSAGCTAGQVDRYGYFLEYGTSKMAARPWAMRSYRLAKSEVRRTMIATARREFQRLTERSVRRGLR